MQMWLKRSTGILIESIGYGVCVCLGGGGDSGEERGLGSVWDR